MSVWNRSHPVLSPLQQHLTPNGGIAVVEYASTIIALRNLFALFFQTPSNAYLYGRFCEWKLKILFGLLSDVLRLTCSPDIRVPTQYAFIVSCISSSVSKAYLAPEMVVVSRAKAHVLFVCSTLSTTKCYSISTWNFVGTDALTSTIQWSFCKDSLRTSGINGFVDCVLHYNDVGM